MTGRRGLYSTRSQAIRPGPVDSSIRFSRRLILTCSAIIRSLNRPEDVCAPPLARSPSQVRPSAQARGMYPRNVDSSRHSLRVAAPAGCIARKWWWDSPDGRPSIGVADRASRWQPATDRAGVRRAAGDPAEACGLHVTREDDGEGRLDRQAPGARYGTRVAFLHDDYGPKQIRRTSGPEGRAREGQ